MDGVSEGLIATRQLTEWQRYLILEAYSCEMLRYVQYGERMPKKICQIERVWQAIVRRLQRNRKTRRSIGRHYNILSHFWIDASRGQLQGC